MGNDEAEQLLYAWSFNARPNQLPPPGSWRTWLLLAGRGFGKTRTGAETVRNFVQSGMYRRVGLIAPTAADARDVMIEGDSGILACCPSWAMPLYEPSKLKLTWPNGAEAHIYSAEEPKRLRGPQHDFIWADELCSWKYPATWDMAMFGLRIGKDPRAIVTTTPKPSRLIKEILNDPNTAVTRGSTYDNQANLAAAFFDQIVRKYEGTRLGQQELMAELLDQAEGALWTRELLEQTRLGTYPTLTRIVVAADPSVTSTENADECGMIVGGVAGEHGYILEDLSKRMSPAATSRNAVNAYELWGADRIVAEANNGGDWIELGIRQVNKNVGYKKLHASRGKSARAEPVAALYEQKRVHHVGAFPELEDELCSWEPNSGMPSPNRLDAVVWAVTELMLGGSGRKLLHVRA